jgi:hypothetical protein
MPTAYLLRIELRDLKPAIYREVLVDPGITLRKLHAVIQAAMGWENTHMHAFAQPGGSQRFWRVPRNRMYEPRNPDDWSEPANDDVRYKVDALLRAPKDKLLYMYDFGDNWEHVTILKSIGETDSPLPHLVKAQNGCPPEDCGGPPGAAQWAGAWHDPKHPEHETALQIYGNQEPGTLDFDQLQKAVRKLQRKKA